MERIIYLAVIISASFALGFICGKAYVKRKMRRREDEDLFSRMEKEARRRGQISNPDNVPPPPKDDEDMKTGELKLEKVTQGHPDDA